jgi:hypothetical protein
MVILEDTMSHSQIADALDKMIFTAAHGWVRSVRMDRNVRNMFVRILREKYPVEKT